MRDRPSTTFRHREISRRRERTVSSQVSLYLIVLLGLQVFLLTVALDALLGYRPTMAWVSAGLSVLLAIGSLLFYRAMRGGRR